MAVIFEIKIAWNIIITNNQVTLDNLLSERQQIKPENFVIMIQFFLRVEINRN